MGARVGGWRLMIIAAATVFAVFYAMPNLRTPATQNGIKAQATVEGIMQNLNSAVNDREREGYPFKRSAYLNETHLAIVGKSKDCRFPAMARTEIIIFDICSLDGDVSIDVQPNEGFEALDIAHPCSDGGACPRYIEKHYVPPLKDTDSLFKYYDRTTDKSHPFQSYLELCKLYKGETALISKSRDFLEFYGDAHRVLTLMQDLQQTVCIQQE